MRKLLFLGLFVAVEFSATGCGDDNDDTSKDGDTSGDSGTDSDTDTDGDSDTDADTDTDTDGDTVGDADTDGDSDTALDDDTSSSLPTTCDGKTLTQWEQMMLNAHNRWRESVEPPAANMYRVYWDRSIAQNAANWVSSCDPDWPHSPEEQRTNVGGYEILGENLSACAENVCSELPEVTDGSGLGDGEGWWGERHDYHWEDNSSTGLATHYTQMVSANVYAIGCATRRCDPPGPWDWDGMWWWTICQYGPRGDAFWVGNKPYEAGEGGLVEPPASVFEQHPDLCGTP